VILSVILTALIAGSACACAVQHDHAVRQMEHAPTSAPFRDCSNAITPAAQANWPYSGYSAPAGADKEIA
jgi:hypothetical protein